MQPRPLFCLSLLLLTCLVSCTSQPERTRPPVVIIALDTVRGDHLHCGGAGWISTPNIDALASEGVYFGQCRTTSPWTGPAFASLFTGLLPYHHGFLGDRWGRLAERHETTAEALGRVGYWTAAYVTIGWLTSAYGMDQGIMTGERFIDEGRGDAARQVTERGLTFARAHRDDPFMLFLHYFDAHAPYTPPAPFDRMYYEGDPRAPGDELLDFLLSDSNRTMVDENRESMYEWLAGVTDPIYPLRQYAAGVSHVDDHVGEVIGGLKRMGIFDEALIVLVADHGEYLGEHGIFYTHSMPFREVTHVPLIIKWPAGEHAGTVVDPLVSLVDVLPTLREFLDLPVDEDSDGRSLQGLVGGGDETVPVFAEQGSSPKQFCKVVVDWPWKLVRMHVDGDWLPPLLYEVSSDPREMQNVAAENGDVVERLSAMLWQRFDRDNALTVCEPLLPHGVDEATIEQLRSLGYVH